MKYKVTVFKSVERDNFQNGCDPSTFQEYGTFFDPKEFDSPEQCLAYAKTFGVPTIFEDRIEVQCQENDDGNEPSAREWEAFKASEIDLWVANYSLYISKVTRVDLEHSDLVQAFPNLEVG